MRIVLELHDLTRAAFDELRGDSEQMFLPRSNQWTAEVEAGRLTMELWTVEPPNDRRAYLAAVVQGVSPQLGDAS